MCLMCFAFSDTFQRLPLSARLIVSVSCMGAGNGPATHGPVPQLFALRLGNHVSSLPVVIQARISGRMK